MHFSKELILTRLMNNYHPNISNWHQFRKHFVNTSPKIWKQVLTANCQWEKFFPLMLEVIVSHQKFLFQPDKAEVTTTSSKPPKSIRLILKLQIHQLSEVSDCKKYLRIDNAYLMMTVKNHQLLLKPMKKGKILQLSVTKSISYSQSSKNSGKQSILYLETA